MESDILHNLGLVGYNGSCTLSKALDGGVDSTDYTSLVSWISEQLVNFGDVEECVHPVNSPQDIATFHLELSFLLKELGCVNEKLTSGSVNERLSNRQDRVLLLDYLVTELMTSKLLALKHPKKVDNSMEITISESPTAKCLKDALVTLGFQKPPENVTVPLLFGKLQNKLKEIVASVPAELLGKPLFFAELSQSQWDQLDQFHVDLNLEYTIRREMLLKRLDVTIQSFLWSERMKQKEDELNAKYREKRDVLSAKPKVTIADLLASRDDLAIVEKTSSASLRKNTRSEVNRVLIGEVPDRGGRTAEIEPPPPEMPPWLSKNNQAGPSHGGGGRGGGGRGGGRGNRYHDNKDSSKNFGQNQDNNYRQQNNYQQQDYQQQQGDSGGQHHQKGNYRNRGGRGGRVQGGWNNRDDRQHRNY